MGTYMKKNIVDKYRGQKEHVNMQCKKANGGCASAWVPSSRGTERKRLKGHFYYFTQWQYNQSHLSWQKISVTQ